MVIHAGECYEVTGQGAMKENQGGSRDSIAE